MEIEQGTRLVLRGELRGHSGWVTGLSTPSSNAPFLVSCSRDKSIIVWDINTMGEGENFGRPKKMMKGHNGFVSNVVLSSDSQYCLSSSWDSTLRLWELKTGQTVRLFAGHSRDVLNVSFSADNRQIVSASRDRSIKLWNTVGQCKYTIADAHEDWVSCVAFSPEPAEGAANHEPFIVSAGWDKMLRVFSLKDFRPKTVLKASGSAKSHEGYINSVTISPDGSLCASGGKDGVAVLWDLNHNEHLYSLDAKDIINALAFSPNRYWLCAATNTEIIIWDVEFKKLVARLSPQFTMSPSSKALKPAPVCLSWSADGNFLYAGYTDSIVRVWQVMSSA